MLFKRNEIHQERSSSLVDAHTRMLLIAKDMGVGSNLTEVPRKDIRQSQTYTHKNKSHF